MRRLLALLVGAGVAVGGGVAAWAGPAGPNREATKACRAEARAADPDADRQALKDAVRTCLEAQGLTRPRRDEPSPEQQARRDALRTCLQGVRSANPDAERAELRELAKGCLEQAGIDPAHVRTKFAELKECRKAVRADHPDAARLELRRLVRECVQTS